MQLTKEDILQKCNQACKNTLMETLAIEFIAVGDNSLTAKMPVTPKVHQPDGVLHGGATVALAESVGSCAAFVFLDASKVMVRGLEIAANHVKSCKEGFVFATAKAVHMGRTTQIWEIKVCDESDNLISLCKLTTITIAK